METPSLFLSNLHIQFLIGTDTLSQCLDIELQQLRLLIFLSNLLLEQLIGGSGPFMCFLQIPLHLLA